MKKATMGIIIGAILVLASLAILQLANFHTGMGYILVTGLIILLVSLFIFALGIKKIWLKIIIILAEVIFISWVIYILMNPIMLG